MYEDHRNCRCRLHRARSGIGESSTHTTLDGRNGSVGCVRISDWRVQCSLARFEQVASDRYDGNAHGSIRNRNRATVVVLDAYKFGTCLVRDWLGRAAQFGWGCGSGLGDWDSQAKAGGPSR